jgi:hypothetical protein
MIRSVAVGAAVAAGAYGTYAGLTWFRYGRPSPSCPDERDELLDQFMPVYDVVERHHVQVDAPADVTFAASRDAQLFSSPLVRSIFRAREIILGATPDEQARPRKLLEEVLSLGWVVLAEIPGREIVLGAVTRPWDPNVTFRGVPPGEFPGFAEPAYVKIAWTLRADPTGAGGSIFRTETRAVATDAFARVRFRRYWSFLSPGIILIRRASLGAVKADAERRVHAAA